MVSTSDERDTISQNTALSRSTRSASSVTTSTPSLTPAVLTANTATTSRQSGGALSMMIWSYSPACSSSSFCVYSTLIWAMAVLRATAVPSTGSLVNRMPKGEAISRPTRQITMSRDRTTAPPAAAAAIRLRAAARIARRAFPAFAAAFLAALPTAFALRRYCAACCAARMDLALRAARAAARPVWAPARAVWIPACPARSAVRITCLGA